METRKKIIEYASNHYRVIAIGVLLFTLITGAFIPLVKVDTDPENMLSDKEAVRVFHNLTKERFDLSDMIVVGIINETDAEGVFNVNSLTNIYNLTKYAEKLQWKDDQGNNAGVVEVDVMAPSTVDHIGQGDSPGEVRFEWLMSRPPVSQAEAMEIKAKFLSNPMLKDTLISADGKAICLYLPITSKDMSYKVYSSLRGEIAKYKGEDKYHITGLPVAEDTFGVEMFIQMAISAPAAMFVIFILMFIFFRKITLVILPMIIAMVSVISTMGLMIGLGFPVHIMSSMIPIFLMPIAVVDSVHILSEFFDLYTPQKGRKAVITEVIGNLFTPMLYTSLTSAAGFASLALTPIPPVQAFGVFVAIGIMIAWFCTIVLAPAYIAMLKESSLADFGHSVVHQEKPGIMSRLLECTGRFTFSSSKPILTVMIIISIIAVYGITKIEINDNPVKWFSKSHPIRQADIELNKHFGGTYMAYLVLDGEPVKVDEAYISDLVEAIAGKAEALKPDYQGVDEILPQVVQMINQAAKAAENDSAQKLLADLGGRCEVKSDEQSGDASDIWYEMSSFFELKSEESRPFKQPQVLRYISALEDELESSGLVGKSNSVAGIVKKVYQEITDGSAENYRIPDTSGAIAQCLLQFQSSHNPQDLWKMVTYDYNGANIWVQLTSGDNRDMESVVEAVDRYMADNPPPVAITHKWAGLTYINTVWQNKMVTGMLESFAGSFLIVFIMMSILFRSPLWGIICMLPLTITIVVIYGFIGFVGKDYDMPVAVLSALTLGMAVDFAIHFLQRARETRRKFGSWQESVPQMFGEPARAISKNVLIIAIGFLPLLAAPLLPYRTVGLLLCAIMALSGAVTLLILPSIIRLMEKRLFKYKP